MSAYSSTISGVRRDILATVATIHADLTRTLSAQGLSPAAAHRDAYRAIEELAFLRFLDAEEKLGRAFRERTGPAAEGCGSFLRDFADPVFRQRSGEMPDERASDIPDQALGNLFERFLDVHVFDPGAEDTGLTHDILSDFYERLMPSAGTGTRRETGAVYTPPPLVRHMCRMSLTEYLGECAGGHDEAERIVRNPETAKGLSPAQAAGGRDALLRCRVCDPAAGTGAFLTGMLREMTRIALALDGRCARPHGAANLAREIAGRCLHGVEVQAAAARVCRLRLALEEAALAGRQQPRDSVPPRYRIAVGDSLFGPREEAEANDLAEPPGPPFDDMTGRAGFDIVIGNPPYVSFGLRGRATPEGEWSACARRRYGRSAEYKISVYALFFELGLRWLRPGGILCYLTPDSFLVGRYFSKLRSLLLDCAPPRRILMIERDLWRPNTVGRPVVTLAVRERPADCVHATLAEDAERLDAGLWRTHTYPQKAFAREPHQRFRLYFSPIAQRYAETMERRAAPLGNVLRVTTGIRARGGQNELVSHEADSEYARRGIVSGAQVHPFRVTWGGHYLRVDPARLYAGGWNRETIERPKLLIRQTGDSIVAALDPDGLYHLNNVHSGAPREGGAAMLRYLCILLNSKAMNRYYHIVSLERGRALAQTHIDMLSTLPTHVPEGTHFEGIVSLWGRIESPEGRAEAEEMLADLYGLDGQLRAYLAGDDLYPV